MPPRAGSITPTTLRKSIPIQVETTQSTTEGADAAKSALSLQAKYQAFQQYNTSTSALQTVIAGVIDPSKLARSEAELQEFDSEFKYKIARLETYKKLVIEYEKFLKENQGLHLYCNEIYSNSNTSVFRFGMDTDQLNPAQSKELAAICDKTLAKGNSVSSKGKKAQVLPHMLHPMEVFQIKEAIKFSITNAHKTVLVDIFERNDDGSIALSPKDGKPGIHTIVLYIQQEQVLVIDPSSSDFSKHIVYNNDVIFGYDNPAQILISPVPLKIYAPPSGGAVGPAPHQFRDCTDIAAKIALGLNKHVGNIDIAKLAELAVIQEITNQKDINDNLFFKPEQTPARIRQASEDNIRKKSDKILKGFVEQMKCMLGFKQETLHDKIREDAIETFAYSYCEPDQYIDDIANLETLYYTNTALAGQTMKDFIL